MQLRIALSHLHEVQGQINELELAVADMAFPVGVCTGEAHICRGCDGP
jgi:hypothetical protein